MSMIYGRRRGRPSGHDAWLEEQLARSQGEDEESLRDAELDEADPPEDEETEDVCDTFGRMGSTFDFNDF